MPYNFRPRPQRILDIQENLNLDIMANPVVMTPEQLTALIQSMKTVLTADQNPSTSVAVPTTASNFSKCQSRFSGKKDEDCDAFIDAISVYKECLHITNENAIKGLSMLLDGFAATWYRGIKSSITSWDDALKSLKHAFGFNKPPHQIFRELFSKEQGDKETTDVFVSSARALLARLPATPALHQTHQIDMIYGLLNRRIRQRLQRNEIETFEDLINKARSIEASFVEKSASVNAPYNNVANSSDKQSKFRPKCTFCRHFGHVQSECRKYASSESRNVESNTEVSKSASRDAPYIVCFSCGTPGYIRLQCPKC